MMVWYGGTVCTLRMMHSFLQLNYADVRIRKYGVRGQHEEATSAHLVAFLLLVVAYCTAFVAQ